MLKLENVSFGYRDGNKALQNVTFEGDAGEFLLILGHNGAGKSTLLRLLNGILKPTEGRIVVNDLDTRTHSTAELAREIAVTFQNPRDQIFATTLEREVALGPTVLKRQNRQELIEKALNHFGFSKEHTAHPYNLPLSRQKLLAVASAVATDSPVLAFDEPSAGLSIPERLTLTNGFQNYQSNRLFLIVSHDLDVFLPLASRVLVFHHGQLVLNAQPSTLLQHERLLRKTELKLPLPMRLRRAFDLRA